MTANDIIAKIKSLAPVAVIDIGDILDKATWSVIFREDATEEQKQAANLFLSDDVPST